MPKQKPAAPGTSVRTDMELRDRLKVYCAKTKISMHDAVNEALTEYLKKRGA